MEAKSETDWEKGRQDRVAKKLKFSDSSENTLKILIIKKKSEKIEEKERKN